MSSAGTNCLTADEVRSFGQRITAMRVSLAVDLVVALVSVITLGQFGQFFWIVPFIPFAVLSLVLYVRASRCPRCRKSVWSNPPPGEDGNPGFAMFGQSHPDHCRACGVRLA